MATAAKQAKSSTTEKNITTLPAYTNPVTPAEVTAYIEALGWTKREFADHLGSGEQAVRRWTNGISDVQHPGAFRLSIWTLALMYEVTPKVARIMRQYGAYDHAFRRAQPPKQNKSS